MEFVVDVETTGLDPLSHRIICIGIGTLDENIWVLYHPKEKKMLKDFWKAVKKYEIDTLVGFNLEFDYRFLLLRSLKYDIAIPKRLKLVDIREILMIRNASLKRLARFLGIGNHDRVSGYDVPELYEKKKIEDIINHVRSDVDLTLGIYLKIRDLI